ncbi:MAG: excinuclease ABC subunit A, partial [Rikenella sp.]|nr:excinuclease ABC subunit A [Rikenella sp.]
MEQYIHVKGARVHNLKDVEIKIPHNKLVVVTGLSGSGKSTLAFDTIFAEGQRRYVESLSAYARQFLGKIEKPDVDFITGIAPAIAVEQKVNTRNPRSTVGTTTEIYDYLRLLFARIGRTFSPVSGAEVRAHTVQDVVGYAAELEAGRRAMVAAPVVLHENQGLIEKLTLLMKDGFERLVFSKTGEVKYLQDLLPEIDRYKAEELAVLIDRFSVPDSAGTDAEWQSRLFDSVQTAFEVGEERCLVIMFPSEKQKNKKVQLKEFSNRFEADGIEFQPPFEHMFSFNNPLGACPRCEGYG